MSVITRYYIEPTGHFQGRMMGRILNKDGTIYTDSMATNQSFNHEDIENSLLSTVVDGYDIRITKAPKDVEHDPNARVDLVFYQEQDDTKKVVAYLRMSNLLLEELQNMIETKRNDFTK